MTDAVDDAGQGGDQANFSAPAEKPPVKQRPKMTLQEQSSFLLAMLRRCEMHTGDRKGSYAGEAILTLTEDDMLRLETIQQTLMVFHLARAEGIVRQAIGRDGGLQRLITANIGEASKWRK